MNKTYQLKVNGDSLYSSNELELEEIDFAQTPTGDFHILKNNKSYKANVISNNFHNKNYQIVVNNSVYNIDIQTPLDELIHQLGFSLNLAKQVNSIQSPMPGLILEINVQQGQEVKQGDNLLILEAMKMENNLTSPRDGVIKTIQVKKGDTVEKGLLLIEFE